MLGVEILSQPFGRCRGSVCVCVSVHTGDSPCWPHRPCPASPVPAQASLVMLRVPPHRQPRAGSCCSGDTAVAQQVAPLHSLCSCRNTSATMRTTQVPSEINTLNCLGPTGASGRAMPSQEVQCQDRSPPRDALVRPKTLSHTLSWDRQTLEEQERPWEDKP